MTMSCLPNGPRSGSGGDHENQTDAEAGLRVARAFRCAQPIHAFSTGLLRFALPKERGHPRDLKRKVEKDRKDREGD